jgi:AP-2 complex subunit alpha
LIKKADTEVDTAEQSALKLRAQQQTSSALVVTDQRPANGTPLSSGTQLSLVKVPGMSSTAVSSSFFFFFFYSLFYVVFS